MNTYFKHLIYTLNQACISFMNAFLYIIHAFLPCISMGRLKVLFWNETLRNDIVQFLNQHCNGQVLAYAVILVKDRADFLTGGDEDFLLAASKEYMKYLEGEANGKC